MATDGGPLAGLRRLLALAETGGLDELCERHGISVLTVFGSAVQGSDSPRDLDVGVLLESALRRTTCR